MPLPAPDPGRVRTGLAPGRVGVAGTLRHLAFTKRERSIFLALAHSSAEKREVVAGLLSPSLSSRLS